MNIDSATQLPQLHTDEEQKLTQNRSRVTVKETVPPIETPRRFMAETLTVYAESAPQLIDITDVVQQVVARARVEHGQVLLFSRHTTATVVVNEDEPLLHGDIKDFLEAMASSSAPYCHDDMSIRTENLVPNHSQNAHAHLKCLVLGCSVTLPVLHSKLALGTWQRVFVLELDTPKPRSILVQVSGNIASCHQE